MPKVWHGESKSAEILAQKRKHLEERAERAAKKREAARKSHQSSSRRTAFLINYAHPEQNLDYVESLEARRNESRQEDFDNLNDIFHLST